MKTIGKRGIVLVATMAIAAIGAAQNIQVTVNGDRVNFTGAEPISINGRVFVPLRGVFESMGAFVEWDPATRTVNAHRNRKDVKLTIGDRYAMVDGEMLTMDSPAMIRHGNTMVPLRFLSEALGANVEWMPSDRMVAITTGPVTFSSRDNNRVLADAMLEKGTVIPVRLESELGSNISRNGDKFYATIRDNNGEYAGLPIGTRIEGNVIAAKAQSGNDPGLLELGFNRMILPDGRTRSLDGSLIGLDNKSIVRNENGVYTARSDKRDDRLVYAGYGAGAGLLVGLLTKKPIEGALLGGALGYLLGQVQKDQRKPSNVYLKPGTEFGVRLDQDLVLRTDR